MAENSQFPPEKNAAWSTIRRNGNDEVPADRNAVKVIRKIRKEGKEDTPGMPMNVQTKVAKLIYEPKHAPTPAFLKSVHTYKTLKNAEINENKKLNSNIVTARKINEENVKTCERNQPLNENESMKLTDDKNEFVLRENNRIVSKSNNIEENSAPQANIETKKTELDKEKFILKKQERTNEFQEIKKMLKQINSLTTEVEKEEILSIESKILSKRKAEPIATPSLVIKQNQKKVKASADTRFKRSKTDMNLKTPKNKMSLSTNTSKTKSRPTTRSRSSTNLSINVTERNKSIEPKKKSYNPEEARKFMQEQKMKRKFERNLEKLPKSEMQTTKINREEIKKRLLELRKNSLKILDNNIKKAKRKTTNLSPNRQVKDKKSDNEQNIQTANVVIPANKNEKMRLEKPQRSKSAEALKQALTLNKKIGILRKMDSDEISLSPLKSNDLNSNSVIENITSRLLNQCKGNDERIQTDLKENIIELNKHDCLSKISQTSNENSSNILKSLHKQQDNENEELSKDLQLSVPNVALKSSVSLKEKSVQVDPPKPEKNQIPYWLKPTPVQIYPYNFIMAVRKKLEAITNPVISVRNSEKMKSTNLGYESNHFTQASEKKPMSKNKDQNKKEFQLEIEKPLEEYKQQVTKSKDLTSNSTSYTPVQKNLVRPSINIEIVAKNADPDNKKVSGSQKSSELESNFSSVSIHLPESNTISEVSSIPSEATKRGSTLFKNKLSNKILIANKEDDTTISSSIFSSPEKRIPKNFNKIEKTAKEPTGNDFDLSPLSCENINKLHIKSKVTENKGISHQKENSTELIEVNKEKTLNKNEGSKSDSIIEFEQLLEDFNKSLSQVIEVNQQIQSTLSNSPRISNREISNEPKELGVKPNKIPSISSKSKTEVYSSDFEEPFSTSTMKFKSSDEIQTKNLEDDSFIKTLSNETNVNVSRSSSTISEQIPKKDKSSTSISTNLQSASSSRRSSRRSKSQYSEIITRDKQISFDRSVKDFEISQLIPENNKSLTPSGKSTISEEFFDSIEEISRTKSSSTINKPVNGKKTSLEDTEKVLTYSNNDPQQVNYFESHINVSRGDFVTNENANNEISEHAPPAYKKTNSSRNVMNSSFGSSEIFTVFNQSDMELSVMSRSESHSESTLNYSSIGMYEQLLQAEVIKSDHLTILLKLREKALIDRTRGQIAWLEVQKEKYKTKGLTLQTSSIRKRQRAILLKMEKEKEEIKRLLLMKSSKVEKSKQNPIRPPLANISDVVLRRSLFSPMTSKSNAIIKGQEVKPNHSLEVILQKREKELKERRAHVERLIQWHERLDKEENEVLQLEQMLFEHNSKISEKSFKELKKQKRIEDIENSLRELQNISVKNDEKDKNNYVRVSGYKLNKLWRRLTEQKIQKYEPTMKYKLKKCDLENLYEEAKIAVLQDFERSDEIKQLLDMSKLDFTSPSNKSLSTESNENLVPQLNLNFSSEQSELEKSNSSSQNIINVFSKSTSNKNKKKLIEMNENASCLNSTDLDLLTLEPINIVEKKSGHDSDEKEQMIVSDNIEMIAKLNQICNSSYSSEGKNEEIESNTRINKQIIEVEKCDTVAEITSLSYDSRISEKDENKSNLKEDNSEMVLESDKNTLNEQSLNFVQSEDDKNCRSSVIVTHMSSNDIQNSQYMQTETIMEESISMKIGSEIPDFESFPTYTEIKESIETAASYLTNSPSSVGNITGESIMLTGDNNFAENKEQTSSIKELERFVAIELENETLIEDISLPKLESSVIGSKSEINISSVETQNWDTNESDKSKVVSPSELEKRLIDLDESLKDLNDTFERVLSPEKSPCPSRSRSPSLNNVDIEKDNSTVNQNNSTFTEVNKVKNAKISNENGVILMPDIINEAEIRRHQQILLESDLKQLEHAVPYSLFREIPNKPPPPYVPPAHGSPMTIIFPSETRIKEITFRRVKEIYEEMIKTDCNYDLKVSSILDENITNIYERIILDICKEMMLDLKSTFNHTKSENYKNSLAFFNPPDRLKCLQSYIYKHIRKVLGMDKKSPKRNYITGIGGRKPDHVDEILIQELYEEEDIWTNFDLEETEVKTAVIDEVFNDIVKEVLQEVIDISTKKVNMVVDFN